MFKDEDIDHLLQISLSSVEKAMDTARTIHSNKHSLLIGNKPDNTPVTLADYCCQYIIMKELKEKFPNIPIIAEEDPTLITDNFAVAIRDQLNEPNLTKGQIQKVIDKSDCSNCDLFWALDPIDGTRGFLLEEGGQYCICLALLKKNEDSQSYEPVIGILGCPDLVKYELVYSVRGKGIFINHRPFPKRRRPIEKSLNDVKITIPRITFQGSHFPFKPKEVITMDSQCKYVILLNGTIDIYYRPLKAFPSEYREKIWDHAAGICIMRSWRGNIFN